jgi:hypothetical protein
MSHSDSTSRTCYGEESIIPSRNKKIEYANRLVLRHRRAELQNRIVGVIGRKGSGKSTLTGEILQRCDRLFLFDTMGEHYWVPDQFTDIGEAHAYIFEHGAKDGSFIASFIPEGTEEDALETNFGEISMAVYEAGNMSFFTEELPMMSQPQYVPPAFNRNVRLGRHHCINIGYTGQRASECPRRVTAATDVFVFFSQTEPRDLDSIAERCSPEVAEIVSNLDQHDFVVYNVASRQLVAIDNRWYDLVLRTDQQWTPAIGRNGRPALWSLNDGA